MHKVTLFVRLGIVIFFLAGVHSTIIPASPVAAQRGAPIPPTRVFPTSTRVLNFAQAARAEAASPRRAQTPITIPPPARPPSARVPQTNPAPEIAPARIPRDLSPAPENSFLALSDNNAIIPPDTMGAVGTAHLVTMLNSEVRIQDKSGTDITTLSLGAFWGKSAPFDPRVVYDPFQNRWIAVVAADARATTSSVCFAVSESSSPTAGWYQACLDVSASNTLWADFPAIGFNKDWIIVTVNLVPMISGSWQGLVYAIHKTNFYAGAFEAYFWSDASTPLFQVPALMYDNSLDVVYLIENLGDAAGTLRKSLVTGTSGANLGLTIGTALVPSALGGWAEPQGDVLPQVGGARSIDVIDARIHNAVARTINGVTSLWCTNNIGLPAGGAPTRYAAQWWELDANPYSSTIYQQGRVQDPTATVSNGGYHYAYPSLAVNRDGDMLIGFSRFSAFEFVSAAYAFRYSTDSANTTRDPIVFKAGEGYYEKTFGRGSNRWGDYSSAAVDPVNDINFWTIQEYAATPFGFGDGAGRWGTWWGYVKLTPTIPSIHFFPSISKEP
ncbi:MAG: hypothetical protein HZC40_21160 [Chloroflexi bacterium]|nr:hypothetical protein [Chloroflexota bacterium]